MIGARLHRYYALAVIAVFVGTGVYLKLSGPELFGGDDAVRFAYRGNHVYILASGLVNLAVGAYLAPHAAGWRRKLQAAGSALLLLAPPLLFGAFLVEAPTAHLHRPLTSVGMIVLLLGTACHAVAGRPRGG